MTKKTNQDESTSVTSVSPSSDILTTGVTRKRKYTVAGLLGEVNELQNITREDISETDSDINVDICSSERRESEGGHRTQVEFVIPVIPIGHIHKALAIAVVSNIAHPQ